MYTIHIWEFDVTKSLAIYIEIIGKAFQWWVSVQLEQFISTIVSNRILYRVPNEEERRPRISPFPVA